MIVEPQACRNDGPTPRPHPASIVTQSQREMREGSGGGVDASPTSRSAESPGPPHQPRAAGWGPTGRAAVRDTHSAKRRSPRRATHLPAPRRVVGQRAGSQLGPHQVPVPRSRRRRRAVRPRRRRRVVDDAAVRRGREVAERVPQNGQAAADDVVADRVVRGGPDQIRRGERQEKLLALVGNAVGVAVQAGTVGHVATVVAPVGVAVRLALVGPLVGVAVLAGSVRQVALVGPGVEVAVRRVPAGVADDRQDPGCQVLVRKLRGEDLAARAVGQGLRQRAHGGRCTGAGDRRDDHVAGHGGLDRVRDRVAVHARIRSRIATPRPLVADRNDQPHRLRRPRLVPGDDRGGPPQSSAPTSSPPGQAPSVALFGGGSPGTVVP